MANGHPCNSTGKKGLRRKVWTRTKMLSPYNIRYFVAVLRFVVIYALFGDLWAKKVPFCGIKKNDFTSPLI